ncbi:MAG: cation:proton antiporter [Candidatus Omnitrophica bacterium]|nr:cation:proton antiporter [Candidatus Omnitrophota bacterium]MBU1127695.1 cation:proton antiporter [Candidatus Omnitrophota bacterium]MBU1784234.1 cation:proton antiporter [Candidatus Omnitrophota bacterium]MBU1851927.1 cation:proton antiporter [Candidatus Omnitrophota bacterium]
MSILVLIGITIILGFIGGRFSNRFKLPAVVGYLFAGVLLGPSFLNILDAKCLDLIGILNDVALGIVAFIIGSEMRMSVLRKMGKGLAAIIFSESFGAFFCVAFGVYFLTHKLHWALIFGAMAPASAPAGTAIVLQEYKAKGPLTNALYAVVGLDDGLAIIIYAFAAVLAKMLMIKEPMSFMAVLGKPLFEIFGAIITGGIMGVILGYFIRKLYNRSEILAVALGGILICSGLARYLNFSLILSNLALGMVFANFFFLANRRTYQALQGVALPIYIIFFVTAGAHLQISLLPAMGVLGLIYIFCRTLGLMGGSYLGATISRSDPIIRKYLGLGILSQAGVAIGLAILATREFSVLGPEGQQMAVVVINTIAATTIVFEIIGPMATKFAISKAGEIGKLKR